VALENFLDLIANLLGTQERPIGLLFQGESLLTSTQGFIEAPGLICLAAARRSMRNLWLNIGSAAKNVQNTGDRSAVLRECPNCRHAEGVREAQGGAKRKAFRGLLWVRAPPNPKLLRSPRNSARRDFRATPFQSSRRRCGYGSIRNFQLRHGTRQYAVRRWP